MVTLNQVVEVGKKLKQNSNLPVKFSALKKRFVTDYEQLDAELRGRNLILEEVKEE